MSFLSLAALAKSAAAAEELERKRLEAEEEAKKLEEKRREVEEEKVRMEMLLQNEAQEKEELVSKRGAWFGLKGSFKPFQFWLRHLPNIC